jgi:hypothetical protein
MTGHTRRDLLAEIEHLKARVRELEADRLRILTERRTIRAPVPQRIRLREIRKPGTIRCRSCERILRSMTSQRRGVCSNCEKNGPPKHTFLEGVEGRITFEKVVTIQ